MISSVDDRFLATARLGDFHKVLMLDSLPLQ